MSVTWYGPQVFAAIAVKAKRNMRAACIHLQNVIKKDLGRAPGPPRGAPAGAGEVPHYRTHQLQKSITYELRGLRGFVGTDHTNEYGIHLELGTVNMAPRPFLRPALVRAFPRLLAILSTP